MKPTRISSALIVRGRTVLLGLRATQRKICPDQWDLIGGHIEDGETPQAALARELVEEIGVFPTLMSPLVVLDFSEEARASVLMHIFLVEGLSGEPRLANAEHTVLRWFAFADAGGLPALASDRYRPIFRSLSIER